MTEDVFLRFPLHIVVALWVLNRISKKKFTIVDPVLELSHRVAVIRTISMRFPENKYITPIIENHCRKLEAECYRLRMLNVAVVGFIPKGE